MFSVLIACVFSPPPPPDHKGPKVADYRRRDALNRLVHPHLLADCGSAQKDRGGVQLGGQSAVSSFGFPGFFSSKRAPGCVYTNAT